MCSACITICPSASNSAGRGVAALLDVRRVRRADQHDAHLLAGRAQRARSGPAARSGRARSCAPRRRDRSRIVPCSSTAPRPAGRRRAASTRAARTARARAGCVPGARLAAHARVAVELLAAEARSCRSSRAVAPRPAAARGRAARAPRPQAETRRLTSSTSRALVAVAVALLVHGGEAPRAAPRVSAAPAASAPPRSSSTGSSNDWPR